MNFVACERSTIFAYYIGLIMLYCYILAQGPPDKSGNPIYKTKKYIYFLRLEQAPRSGVHPHEKSDKSVCVFLETAWRNKKVDPERYISMWFI